MVAIGLQRLGSAISRIKNEVEQASKLPLTLQRSGRPDAEVLLEIHGLKTRIQKVYKDIEKEVQTYEEELRGKEEQIYNQEDKAIKTQWEHDLQEKRMGKEGAVKGTLSIDNTISVQQEDNYTAELTITKIEGCVKFPKSVAIHARCRSSSRYLITLRCQEDEDITVCLDQTIFHIRFRSPQIHQDCDVIYGGKLLSKLTVEGTVQGPPIREIGDIVPA